VLDGVERLHFEFGVDTNLDGQLDYLLPTTQMSADLWQQSNSRIITIRYYVLLRARQPDPTYTNNHAYFHAWRSPNSIQADQLITSMPIRQ
jgi:type IV pilus assembly protein PilW